MTEQQKPQSLSLTRKNQSMVDDAQQHLNAIHTTIQALSKILSWDEMLAKIVEVVCAISSCNRAVIFALNDESSGLIYGATSRVLPEAQEALEKTFISLQGITSESTLYPLMQGQIVRLDEYPDTNTRLGELSRLLKAEHLYFVPLLIDEQLLGLLIIDVGAESTSDEMQGILKAIIPCLCSAIYNARTHSETITRLNATLEEMNIMHRIDEELNDTMALDTVFTMTLDWALRFTNAHVASLALYDAASNNLQVAVDYGYTSTAEQRALLRREYGEGIAHRVARSGLAENIPDVTIDPNYIPLDPNVKSHLSVPVMRENRVVAIISLESYKLNGFTDEHQTFVEKLATRAGVAIDNARLFTETVQERIKLAQILRNIADIVLVIDEERRITLSNDVARSVLRLGPDGGIGQTFSDIITHTGINKFFQRAVEANERIIGEIELPNKRVYHASATPQENIGWIIVLQDITPFKEMDALKNELIDTVSHDLKQPLSVMSGYLDLLQMFNEFDERSTSFMGMLNQSVQNMRQLIDDLLDLARIESGENIQFAPVPIYEVIQSCVEIVKGSAENKQMTLEVRVPTDLPPVRGERGKLRQIFTNLLSNAIKYTPPEGHVTVAAELRGMMVRVEVKDNGLGISPEDQTHIFDRFYRVRRPETDSIEGTGLGLAIVKKLVESHQGKIGLESRLGEGSTFYVTLPVDN